MAVSLEDFVQALLEYELVSADHLTKLLDKMSPHQQIEEATQLAQFLTDHKRLTRYQAAKIYQGKANELVLGEYVLLDKLGSGSMGIVYKARHRRMQRVVAVKVLAPTLAQFDRALKRFHREVRASAKLIHPNVVTAFDANEYEGSHFLVMEFVDGTDLATLVKRNGPLLIDEAVNYILQVSRGLHYAHQQGVVHRDVKPSNFLLDNNGVVKLLDLGLARFDAALLAEDDLSSAPSVLTQSGFLLGTAGFMAPEQSINAKAADLRADIYSLGCSLYFLLTGKMLYEAPSAFDMALAHCDRPIPALQEARFDVSEKLARVYERMVAKSPADRYQSVAEVIAALEPAGDKHPDPIADTRTGPIADLKKGHAKNNNAPAQDSARPKSTQKSKVKNKSTKARTPLREKGEPASSAPVPAYVPGATLWQWGLLAVVLALAGGLLLWGIVAFFP